RKKVEIIKDKHRDWRVIPIGGSKFEVRNGYEAFKVDEMNMSCSCRTKSQETLTRPRFAFRIVRTQTLYDRDSDRSGSRSGSLYSAFPEHINQRTEVYWYVVPKSIGTAYRSLLNLEFKHLSKSFEY
ncbi:hypothetical protein Tco_0055440, partial [Tanacetum coccineum]